jgi:hypothetical protein
MIVYKVNLDGTLSHKEHMNNWDEVNTWLADKLGKFATVKIESESSDKEITLTDNGWDWEEIKDTKEIVCDITKKQMDFEEACKILTDYGDSDLLNSFEYFLEMEATEKSLDELVAHKKARKAFLIVKEGMGKLLAPISN